MLLEMPHGVYDDEIIDFRVEKLPVPKEQKKHLVRAFRTSGIYGFSSRIKRWIKFQEKGTKIVQRPPKDQSIILPNDWEKYAMIIRESKLRNVIKEEVSNLLRHAYKELKLAGYDPRVTEINSDEYYANMVARSALKLVHEFSKHGHSGFSAPMAVKLFDKLVRWENLTPLTSHRKEWMDVSEYGGEPGKMWQNRRNPAIFSEDGGKTWYNVDEKVVKEAKQLFRREVMRITELRQIIRGVIKEELNEKWKDDVEIKQTGEHAGKTIAQLKKEIEALKGKPGNKEKMGELLFALRAKQGWKKGKGATGLPKEACKAKRRK